MSVCSLTGSPVTAGSTAVEGKFFHEMGSMWAWERTLSILETVTVPLPSAPRCAECPSGITYKAMLCLRLGCYTDNTRWVRTECHEQSDGLQTPAVLGEALFSASERLPSEYLRLHIGKVGFFGMEPEPAAQREMIWPFHTALSFLKVCSVQASHSVLCALYSHQHPWMFSGIDFKSHV